MLRDWEEHELHVILARGRSMRIFSLLHCHYSLFRCICLLYLWYVKVRSDSNIKYFFNWILIAKSIAVEKVVTKARRQPHINEFPIWKDKVCILIPWYVKLKVVMQGITDLLPQTNVQSTLSQEQWFPTHPDYARKRMVFCSRFTMFEWIAPRLRLWSTWCVI